MINDENAPLCKCNVRKSFWATAVGLARVVEVVVNSVSVRGGAADVGCIGCVLTVV